MRHAVHERVDPKAPTISGDGDVDREGDLGWIADRTHLMRCPLAFGVLPDQPNLGGKRGGCDGPVLAGSQCPANLKGGPWYVEYLSGLHALEVPHHHGGAEVLHGLRVLDDFAQAAHVVVPASKPRSQHHVLGRVDRDVIAVSIPLYPAYDSRGDLVLGDVGPLVVVQREAGDATLVSTVRKIADKHPSRQRVVRVWTGKAGLCRQVGDGLNQARLARVRSHVKDIDLAVVESTRPQGLAVIRVS